MSGHAKMEGDIFKESLLNNFKYFDEKGSFELSQYKGLVAVITIKHKVHRKLILVQLCTLLWP